MWLWLYCDEFDHLEYLWHHSSYYNPSSTEFKRIREEYFEYLEERRARHLKDIYNSLWDFSNREAEEDIPDRQDEAFALLKSLGDQEDVLPVLPTGSYDRVAVCPHYLEQPDSPIQLVHIKYHDNR